MIIVLIKIESRISFCDVNFREYVFLERLQHICDQGNFFETNYSFLAGGLKKSFLKTFDTLV